MLAQECRLRLGTSRSRVATSHIWPKEGQIWGTLVRGNETSPTGIARRHYALMKTYCRKYLNPTVKPVLYPSLISAPLYPG